MRFPAVFSKAKNAFLYTEDGKRYIDFFAAAGSLNYGHNNAYIKKRVIHYLEEDGILQGLDMDTTAKIEFFEYFREHILDKRGMEHKIELCGPTGTNAVEAALRLARKVTGRTGIFSMAGSFHGMTAGSLSVSSIKKAPTDYQLTGAPVTFVPYSLPGVEGYDPLKFVAFLLEYQYSGTQAPAAFILETIQAEGGVNERSPEFLRGLESLLRKHKVLLIIDDIQVGCYRTGAFFSFEESGIQPDFVALSKSISGFGLPMSILLMKPEHDIWEMGEHSGTFRGAQLSFIGAKAGLEFAEEENIPWKVTWNSEIIEGRLRQIANALGDKPEIRGKGMIWGIDLNPFHIPDLGVAVSEACFAGGLVIEVCGPGDNVLKLMPPLTIEEDALREGLGILEKAVLSAVAERKE
jgi:diaminobutyrate-2-oxoglutarate transaminase